MNPELAVRCAICGLTGGNHRGNCRVLRMVTEHSVFGPQHIEMEWTGDEDNASEVEETPSD